MKVRLTLEYDGSHFSGWQEQPGISTVQATLRDTIEQYLRSERKKARLFPPPQPHESDLSCAPDPDSETVHLTGSGRTDAGVHARGQVASFPWPKELELSPVRLVRALNGMLPVGVAVIDAEPVDDSFDARFSPHVKQYTYTIALAGSSRGLLGHYAWHVRPTLDVAAMCSAARELVGTHDFSAFRAGDCAAKSTIRTLLRSELARVSQRDLCYVVQGKGFLKQMVRITVGYLVAIGKGSLSREAFLALRDGRAVRPSSLRIAPPGGLMLDWVRYLDRDYFEGATESAPVLPVASSRES